MFLPVTTRHLYPKKHGNALFFSYLTEGRGRAKMTTDEKKQWLDRARIKHRDVLTYRQKYDAIQAARTLTAAPANGRGLHPVQSPPGEIERIREQCLRAIVDENRLILEIMDAIANADISAECAVVLTCKYLDFLTLPECADKLQYSRGHVCRLHRQALQGFEIPEGTRADRSDLTAIK